MLNLTRPTILKRACCLVLILAISASPAFSDNLNNADLLISYSRTSSLQPRTIDTPDIRLYSDLTVIVHRPKGYRNAGEHKFQLSNETFAHLMQLLSETVSNSAGTITQPVNTDQSVNQDLQNIVIRSDPSVSTIQLTEAATNFLQALTQSVNSTSLEPETSAPKSSSLSLDESLGNSTTSVTISSPLQQQLLQLYKDLDDVPANGEVQ